MSNHVYWTETTGQIISEQHGTFTIARRGPAFQLGLGGDVTRAGYGASGWFIASGGDGFYNNGDVNLSLGGCNPDGYHIKWATDNGNIVGSDKGTNVSIDEPGVYSVTVIDHNGCEETTSITINDCNGSTGVVNANESMFRVYPNPVEAGGNVTILLDEDTSGKSSETTSQDVKVTIYSMVGAMVQAPRTFNVDPKEMVINLDVSSLSEGTYIIKLDGDDWSESHQVVVNNSMGK